MNAFQGSSTVPGPPVSTSPAAPTAPTLPSATSTSTTGTAAPSAPVAPPGSSADPTTVTPVTPASHQAAPSAALDKVAGEPSILEKALGMAQPYIAKVDAVTHPYVEKVQQTTKPYTDAALNKAKELADRIEGQGSAASGTPTAAAAHGGSGATTIGTAPGEKSLGSTASSTTAAHSSATSSTFEDKVDSAVDALARRLSTVGQKIDEKTAPASGGPGLFSKVMGAVGHLTDKADSFIQGHAPHTTNATSTIGHPIGTTTNTVPHTDKVGDPIAPASATSATAPTSTTAGPTPTATAGSVGVVPPA